MYVKPNDLEAIFPAGGMYDGTRIANDFCNKAIRRHLCLAARSPPSCLGGLSILGNFISMSSGYGSNRKRRSHVRRSRGHSRTGLIGVEAAGRSLWLLGDPKK